jgi:hypothetical protein
MQLLKTLLKSFMAKRMNIIRVIGAVALVLGIADLTIRLVLPESGLNLSKLFEGEIVESSLQSEYGDLHSGYFQALSIQRNGSEKRENSMERALLKRIQKLTDQEIKAAATAVGGRALAVSAENPRMLDMLDLFINHQVDINTADASFTTPLEYAISAKNKEAFLRLLKAGVKPRFRSLITGVISGDIEVVRKILDVGISIDPHDKYSRSPLNVAIANKLPEMVKFFLERDSANSIMPTIDSTAFAFLKNNSDELTLTIKKLLFDHNISPFLMNTLEGRINGSFRLKDGRWFAYGLFANPRYPANPKIIAIDESGSIQRDPVLPSTGLREVLKEERTTLPVQGAVLEIKKRSFEAGNTGSASSLNHIVKTRADGQTDLAFKSPKLSCEEQKCWLFQGADNHFILLDESRREVPQWFLKDRELYSQAWLIDYGQKFWIAANLKEDENDTWNIIDSKGRVVWKNNY